MAQEDIGTLVVKIETDLKKFNKGLSKARSKIGEFSKKAAKGFAIAGAAVAGAAVIIGVKSIKAASDAEEMQSKFNTVFSELSNDAESWASSFRDAVGGSQVEIKGMIADSQDMLTGFGASTEGAFDLSTRIQSLGTDLASFQNIQGGASEAVERLRKGLLGETENLKALGIVINENTLNQKLAADGDKRKFQELSELEKIELRYAIAVKQSKNAIGDAEKTSGGFANQMRNLKGILEDASASFGSILLPVATEAVKTLSAFVPTLQEIVPPLLEFIKPLFSKLVPIMQRLIERLLPVFIELLDSFVPILDPLIDLFLLLIEKGLVPMLENMVPIIETIMPVFIDFINILIEVLGPLLEQLSLLGPVLGIVGIGLLLLISPIGLIGAAIIALIAGITLLIKNWETVSEFFVKIWTDISNFFIGISEKIVSTAKSIWKGFIDFFIVTIPEAFNKFIGFIASLPEKVFKFIKDLFIEKIPFAIGFAIGFMIKTVKEGIPKLLKFFAELPAKVGAFLVETINRIIEWGKRTKEKASETGKNFIAGIIDFIKTLPSKIGKWIKNVISEIIGLVPKVIKAAKSIGKGILDGIVDFIKTLPGKILSGLTKALNVVKNIGKKIGKFISGIFGGIGKGVSAGTAAATQGPNIPGLAQGGEVTRAGRVLVGERGKEELLLPGGAQVRPLDGIDENKIGQAVARALMPLLGRESVIVMDGQKVAKTLWLPMVREKNRLGVDTL